MFYELEVKYKDYWNKTKIYQNDSIIQIGNKLTEIMNPVQKMEHKDYMELIDILGRRVSMTENENMFRDRFDISFRAFEEFDLGECHGYPLYLNKIVTEIKGHSYHNSLTTKICNYMLHCYDDDFINNFFGEDTEVIERQAYGTNFKYNE